MNSTFDIFSAKTVPSDYSWDKGGTTNDVSFTFGANLCACSTSVSNNEGGVEYIGYAPFVFVSLSSAPGSVSETSVALRRTADFGDFYNSDSNFVTFPTLSNELFCHVYVMPGLYSVRFERTEYIKLSSETLQVSGGELYIQPAEEEGRSPLSWQWYNFFCQSVGNPYNAPTKWSDSSFQQPEQLTWTGSSGPCLDELTIWKWDNITLSAGQFNTDITWDGSCSVYDNLTWDYIRSYCAPVISSSTQTITKEALIRVLEIPPTVYLEVQQSSNRTSPLTVRLSPKSIVCGSFPIEKIVWDLGDGSPLLTQRRWSNTLEEPFVYSGALSEDYQDPRNYDVVHTYIKTPQSQFSFYPSITAYASSTNSSDCASVMVGPLKLPTTTGSNFKLLQNELSEHGKVLIGQIDDNVAVWRTLN